MSRAAGAAKLPSDGYWLNASKSESMTRLAYPLERIQRCVHNSVAAVQVAGGLSLGIYEEQSTWVVSNGSVCCETCECKAHTVFPDTGLVEEAM